MCNSITENPSLTDPDVSFLKKELILMCWPVQDPHCFSNSLFGLAISYTHYYTGWKTERVQRL